MECTDYAIAYGVLKRQAATDQPKNVDRQSVRIHGHKTLERRANAGVPWYFCQHL